MLTWITCLFLNKNFPNTFFLAWKHLTNNYPFFWIIILIIIKFEKPAPRCASQLAVSSISVVCPEWFLRQIHDFLSRPLMLTNQRWISKWTILLLWMIMISSLSPPTGAPLSLSETRPCLYHLLLVTTLKRLESHSSQAALVGEYDFIFTLSISPGLFFLFRHSGSSPNDFVGISRLVALPWSCPIHFLFAQLALSPKPLLVAPKFNEISWQTTEE